MFVEIKAEHIEHIIVHCSNHLTVSQLLNLLQNETNNAAFHAHELQLLFADDDGDLDDDYPAPDVHAIISALGMTNFYVKIKNALTEEQKNELRRNTQLHKGQLMSTEEADKRYNEEIEESESESEDEYGINGCCVVL